MSRLASIRVFHLEPGWATQLLFDWAVGSNSRRSSTGVRPAWARSTSRCRNPGGNGLRDLGEP